MPQNFQRAGTDSISISDAEGCHVAVHPSKVPKFLSFEFSLIATIKTLTYDPHVGLLLLNCKILIGSI